MARPANWVMAHDFWPQVFDRSPLTLRSFVPGSPQQSSRINHRHGDILETEPSPIPQGAGTRSLRRLRVAGARRPGVSQAVTHVLQ
jgi:hypothetical protein